MGSKGWIKGGLITESRGVSPVIGVILMVAITVILAAIMGSFVLDIGQINANDSPQASLTVDSSTANDEITIEHVGGDSVDAARTRLAITNESDGATVEWASADEADPFRVGDTVVVKFGSPANVTDGTWEELGDGGEADGDMASVLSGVTYTIALIDEETQRITFETTITA